MAFATLIPGCTFPQSAQGCTPDDVLIVLEKKSENCLTMI
jgi:hypothetical protein